VTGDTENGRWKRIAAIFGNSIKCDALDAPHHGSKNGIASEAFKLMKPNVVLISAGVGNKFSHPDAEAVKIFGSLGAKVYSTNDNNGQSIRTEITRNGTQSFLYTVK
jgi:competence protein ComEC